MAVLDELVSFRFNKRPVGIFLLALLDLFQSTWRTRPSFSPCLRPRAPHGAGPLLVRGKNAEHAPAHGLCPSRPQSAHGGMLARARGRSAAGRRAGHPAAALRNQGSWQFSGPRRCRFGGHGNRAGAPTGRSSRSAAESGVVAGQLLPRPRIPQRLCRQDCHDPQNGNAGEGAGEKDVAPWRHRPSQKKSEISPCVRFRNLYTLLLCERAHYIPRWRSGSAADC